MLTSSPTRTSNAKRTRNPVRAGSPLETEEFRRGSAAGGFEEPRLARLEDTRGQLWEALRVPGLEGQAGLFGRLEELQEALEDVRRDADFVSGHRGDVVRAIRSCQETLQRMERVYAFLEGLIEERVGQSSDSVYGDPREGRAHFRSLGAGSAGNWEG